MLILDGWSPPGAGEGTRPGIAAGSSQVYAWRGPANSSPGGPDSTTRPARMTATWCAICRPAGQPAQRLSGNQRREGGERRGPLQAVPEI